jgi:hypothetical protein
VVAGNQCQKRGNYLAQSKFMVRIRADLKAPATAFGFLTDL